MSSRPDPSSPHSRRSPRPNRRGSTRILLIAGLLALAGVAFLLLTRESPRKVGQDLGFPFVALELRYSDHHVPEATTATRVFQATRELEGVTVRAEDYAVQSCDVGGEQELMLIMRGVGEKQIDIAGDYGSRQFFRLVLRFLTIRGEAIRISLLRDGQEIVQTESHIVNGSWAPQDVVIDLPHSWSRMGPLDGLRIAMEGRSKPSALLSVDILEQPLELWLPAPDAPAPVEIGQESRIAVGLSSRHPLETETILPPDAHLSFGYGRLRGFSLPVRAEPRVRVIVTQGEREESHEFELEHGSEDVAQWKSAEISLSGFADRRAHIRFELLVDGETERLCALASPTIFTPGSSPPTVLLITSDTHRADHLGIADSEYALETPTLDALAARGIYFEQAYSSTNITNPSHIALMTATHPRDTEIVNNETQLSSAARTLAECFREAGYMTMASLATKHLAHEGSGLGQGFDRMIRPEHSFTDAQIAIDQLEQCLEDASERPLFIWLHVFDAHYPYAPPEEFDRRYWDSERDPFDPSLPPVELPDGRSADSIFPHGLVGLRDLEFPRSQYKAEITYLDDQLGRILAWPRLENALIAMTADHGESFGEHGVYYDHAGAYPQTIHVPLILAGPSVPIGVRSTHPVQQIDVGRTLLNLSGLREVRFPGTDLLRVIENPDLPERPLFTISVNGHDGSVTYERLHLVLHLRSLRPRYEHGHTELYDLDSDPACTVDLWDEPGFVERGAQLRALLIHWLARAEPTGWAVEGTMSAESLADLARLGYASIESERDSRVWFEEDED